MPVGLLHLSCPAHNGCYAKSSMSEMFATNIYLLYPSIVHLASMKMTPQIRYKKRVYW